MSSYDVIVERGWSSGPDHSHAIFGVVSESERGDAFLSAWFENPEDDDGVLGSGTVLPEELDNFRRMAAAAGVRLKLP
jgi:hypothetical protein